MKISSEHITAFAMGAGAAAVGYYAYRKKQPQIDEWLRRQGINLPKSPGRDVAGMSLEDLVLEKERLEDLIAEREMADAQPPEDAEPEPGA